MTQHWYKYARGLESIPKQYHKVPKRIPDFNNLCRLAKVRKATKKPVVALNELKRSTAQMRNNHDLRMGHKEVEHLCKTFFCIFFRFFLGEILF